MSRPGRAGPELLVTIKLLRLGTEISIDPQAQLATIARFWPNGLARDVQEVTLDQLLDTLHQVKAQRERSDAKRQEEGGQKGHNSQEKESEP